MLAFWRRYRWHFHTRTRDQGPHAYDYLSGLLRLSAARTYTAIAREAQENSDNIQHFMSNSPWDWHAPIAQVQRELTLRLQPLQDRILILDESADAKAGLVSAGSGRQYNGRLGKTDVCQVGVFLALAWPTGWTWIDGALYVPEAWFEQTDAATAQRKRVGLPADRTFHTKVALGWQLIEQVQQAGVPFDWLACDDLYGRAAWFRARLAAAHITYMADVPSSTQVYVTSPADDPSAAAVPVSAVATLPDTVWTTLRVRATERGFLETPHAARRVWTLQEGQLAEEWLLLRQDQDGDCSYALSNALPETPVPRLAEMKAGRCFVECSIRDAKAELGWDEFQALKYRAWEHQLALTIMAGWFVSETRLDWQARHPPDATLLTDLAVEQLPHLSVANVRELLRAALPLRQLTLAEAQVLVVQHLLNRTRSRRSRLKKKQQRANLKTREPV